MRSCTRGRAGTSLALAARLALALMIGSGCSSPGGPSWQIVTKGLPAGVLSVWGTSATDVYVVGADSGMGPLVEHFDGTTWTRIPTSMFQGTLWWVFGVPGGPVFMGGDGGLILTWDGSQLTQQTTPGGATVFGLWGTSATDMWAVGGQLGGEKGAFAWRLGADQTWTAAPQFPTTLAANQSMWKMAGRATDDAWMVGTTGTVLHWDGTNLTQSTAGDESLFTVNADAEKYVAVGGFGTGLIYENDGSGWQQSATEPEGMVGVCLSDHGDYVVGDDGAVYTRQGTSWVAVDTGFDLAESFHSVWVDPSGGVWAVGGQTALVPPTAGIVVHLGAQVPNGGLQ